MSSARYLLLFLSFSGAASLWADDSVVFRSDVALVRLDAQVVDRNNRTITGLGPSDFVLRESGAVQKIQSVDSEKLPVDLLLLLDVSASMRPHIQRISDASHDALTQLHADDRIAIMVFDRSTRIRMAFRNNRSDVERELQRLLDQETFRGGTDITLGLYDAASYIRREGRPEARKAIVIVTDDQTERERDVEGVSQALTRSDAVLSALIAPDAMAGRNMGRNRGGYPGGGGGGVGGGLGGIIFGQPRGPYGRRLPPGYPAGGGGTHPAGTEEIARRSGGDSMPVYNSYALEDTLARIRQRYAINFYLPPGVRAGEQRDVQLELAANTFARYPGAEVRYRRSYYAPSGSAPVSSNDGVVVSRAGETPAAGDPDRPVMRRRPAVSQPDIGHDGPVLHDDGAPTAAPAPAPAPSAAPSESTGGWRKARPEDLPQ